MEDRSRFKLDEYYRCRNCGKSSLGEDLLPIKTRKLVEDENGIHPIGEVFIGNRVCPFDRGIMEIAPIV